MHGVCSKLASTSSKWISQWKVKALMGQGDRIQISDRMRAILDYPKFRGPGRLLILDIDYLFEESWIRAAEALGWATTTVPSVSRGLFRRDDIGQLLKTIAEFKPDFILGTNFAGMDPYGLLPRYFEDARIPYVSWFVDCPRTCLLFREVYCSPYSVAAIWDRAYEPYLRGRGFEHVLFLPLATDPAHFSGECQETWARELAFVGNSMIDMAREARKSLQGWYPELYKLVEEGFETGRINRHDYVLGLDNVLPASMLENLEEVKINNIEFLIQFEGTARMRTTLIERMNPYGVEVRGDVHWLELTPRCGGKISYASELARYYRETAINLNITNLQMATSVNQRVFDAPAAGGFLLTDRQSDLEILFDPESEIATYASWDELEEKVQYYGAHPAERRVLIQKAQQRILAEHTYVHRLRTLEAFLRERYA